MKLQAVEEALAPIGNNAAAEDEMGKRWEDVASQRDNGPEEFRTALTELGNGLRRSNITLDATILSLRKLVETIIDARKKLQGAPKALKKAVLKNVKTDLEIAAKLDALLNEYHEKIPEEVLEQLDNDIATLREENPELLESANRVQGLLIQETRSTTRKLLLNIAMAAGLALGSAQIGSCVQEKTGQSPAELAYEKITASDAVGSSPSDSQ